MPEAKMQILSPGQMREDIIQLADLYKRMHPPAISEFPVRNLSEDLESLAEKVTVPLSWLEFYQHLAPLVNGTGDEHTHMLLPNQYLWDYADSGTFFPLDINILDEKIYITGYMDEKECKEIRGKEILAINGHSSSEILASLKVYFSGTSDHQRLFFLENCFPEAYYLNYGESGLYNITIKTEGIPDIDEITLTGTRIKSDHHDFAFPILNASPLRVKHENSFQRLGDRCILFDFRAFQSTGNEFAELIKRMFQVARDEKRDHLIIDMRMNLGGNSFLANKLLSYFVGEKYHLLKSAELFASEELKQHFLSFIPPLLRMTGVQYLHPWTSKLWRAKPGEMVPVKFKAIKPRKFSPQKFKGKVTFLTGPGDYSSSAILLGTVKHYKMGTIIGESSGGYPTHYGNCILKVLENSRLKVLLPASINYGLGRTPVLPDHEILVSPDDLIAGRDPVLDFALDLN